MAKLFRHEKQNPLRLIPQKKPALDFSSNYGIITLSLKNRKEIKMFTAIIKKSDPWWIGWVEEIPGVNCQEKTKEELIISLKSALKEALEIYRINF